MVKTRFHYRPPSVRTMIDVTQAKTGIKTKTAPYAATKSPRTLLNAERGWKRRAGDESEPKLFRWLRHLFK